MSALLVAPGTRIVELDRVEIALEPWSWPFAVEQREAIDRHFAERQKQRQGALWNGRVLLLHRHEICDRVLQGACFETDYASFLAWREWNFPDANVASLFTSAALKAADGAYLVGEMGPSTAGAGTVHFPNGTLDPGDVRAGVIDVAGSLRRELLEETGIDIATLEADPGWLLVQDGGYLALMKRLTARESSQAFRTRILSHLAQDAHPEFCAINIVRGRADLDSRMPRFMLAFLEREFPSTP